MPKTLLQLSESSTNTPEMHSGGPYRTNFIKRSDQTQFRDLSRCSFVVFRCLASGFGDAGIKVIVSSPDVRHEEVCSFVGRLEPQSIINPMAVQHSDDLKTDLDLRWYSNALQRKIDAEASKVSANKEVLSGIMTLIAQKQFKIIDQILSKKKTFEMPSATLVTIARATYLGREYLQEWNGFLAAVRDVLGSRGEDVQKTLRGLI